MAAFAGPLQLEREGSVAIALRMREAATRDRPGARPIEAKVLGWQSTAGNAAVARLLQQQAGPDEAGGAGGGGARSGAPTHAMLRYGDRGDEVRDLQARLNNLNAARVPLAIDGIFGRKTQAAVRTFQEAHPPLAVDGDAGTETWGAIERVEKEPPQAQKGAGAEPDPFETGQRYYVSGQYGRAYDEFTKAYEADGGIELLYDRAQALRFMGGRRDEAIALYQQVLKEDVGEDIRKRVQGHIDELRGPARSADEDRNTDAANELFDAGRKLYEDKQYARAYDEFTKAFDLTHDPALLWNRAQALRLGGGRRSEAISLYEQIMAAAVPDDFKKAAAKDIAELRGPVKGTDERANLSLAEQLDQKGKKHYGAEEYAQAYDAFTDAHRISGLPEYLYNRAQSLRLLGGRRDEAIRLFEQFIAANVSEDDRKAARRHLEDLKGPARRKAEQLPF